MRDVPHAERMKVAHELTSDYDNCGSDTTNRCGRPHDHSFEADQESLFIDYSRSASYSTNPKRHLTSLAVRRDIFRSFFGTGEDDLDRQPCFDALWDTIHKDENKSEVMGDVDHIDRNEEANDATTDPESAEIQLPSQSHLTSEKTVDMKEQEAVSFVRLSIGHRCTCLVSTITTMLSLAEASRLLSKTRIGKGKPMFTV